MLELYGRNGGSCSSRGVRRTAKWDSTGYCTSPPSTASTSYCSSTVDLLQPPPATIHPRAPVHPASTARSSTIYCSTSPFHGVLFHHPSTGYCSSSPPPATVQLALHGVLFIQPSTGSCSSTPNRLDRSGSYSSSGNGLYYHGVLFIQAHTGNFSSKPPNNAHCSSRGSIDRLQLAVVAKESLGFS